MKLVQISLLTTILFTSSSVHSALIIYDTRATFNIDNPGLPIETFEEGNIAPNTVVGSGGPLNSTTNDSLFVTGDILAGISIEADSNPIDPLAFYGPGAFGLPSKTIAAGEFSAGLDLVFIEGVSAVGFDVFNIEFSTSPITISIFGESGLLGVRSVTALNNSIPDFFGVVSDMELITRINLFDSEDIFDGVEGVDNIAFGVIPLPSAAFLLMSGLAVLATVRKRKLESTTESRENRL